MGCQGSKTVKAPTSRDEISFEVCGKVGAVVNYASGHIDEVLEDSQAKRLGVKKGWRIILVDDEAYTRQRLEAKVVLGAPFRMTFLKAGDGPTTLLHQEPVSSTLLQGAAGESKALKKEPQATEGSTAAVQCENQELNKEPEVLEDSTTERKHETQELEKEVEEAEGPMMSGKHGVGTVEKEGDVDAVAPVDLATGQAANNAEENLDGETETKQSDTVGECTMQNQEIAAVGKQTEEANDPVAAKKASDEIVPEAEIVQEFTQPRRTRTCACC